MSVEAFRPTIQTNTVENPATITPEWWPTILKEAGPTAAHESQHVLLGYKRGIPAEFVSIIPGDDYRGVTSFSGNLNLNPEAFQIIASGGMIDPVRNRAEGYGHELIHGSDLNISSRLSKITGKSVQQAKQEAKDELDSIHENVRKIVADVIETMTFIDGSDRIEELIRTAHLLANQSLKYERRTPPEKNMLFANSILEGYTTTLITPFDKPTYVRVDKKSNNPIDKDFICPNCGGKNTHKLSCADEDNQPIIIFDANSNQYH